MSKIQDALNKLKQEGALPVQRTLTPATAPAVPPEAATPTEVLAQPAARPSSQDRVVEMTPVSIARKKKVTIDGPKHAIDQHHLIQAGLLAPLDQAVPIADEFRRIKRPLITNATATTNAAGEPDDHMNVIMITSALPNAGKTFCSMNLALSMSLERELNVLLVDADVAKRHITRELGLAEAPGLTDLLLDDSLQVDESLVRTDMNDIQVLPAGRGHPQATELLASDRMSRIIRELATRYSDRIILLDSPPLLITSEAQALASQVGQIALVVEAGETTQQSLLQTIEVLDRDKAINCILNKSRHSSQFGYYGGDYGYYGYE
ncbi:MAG TPA: XrtA-associated tyrosine autokinase [Woeseiaceae bacterium]|nr:XrtA-associated tyrosine autokinase [Woeseiaceae bacterium]